MKGRAFPHAFAIASDEDGRPGTRLWFLHAGRSALVASASKVSVDDA
eukprot:CAMPEP_0168459012 /NCGR_PEP_ID=MMETSP0228-20121227/52685_1 /TAXON_ID=133427 /ORGANISM="Protoceratium reticulatum, Strain CCCM 535 (=CCMP 1889)" /LENGTH=46 /DNA_ID= /DNA_START= /DNA_END= /DNA_ORIENTATION=